MSSVESLKNIDYITLLFVHDDKRGMNGFTQKSI